MRHFGSLLTLLAVLLTVGCSGGQRREPAELPNFDSPIGLKKVWRTSLGNPEGSTLTPAVSGDRVCGASAHIVACFDIDTGKEIFERKTSQKITGGVGSSEGEVFFVGEDGLVTLLDSSGLVVWETNLSNSGMGAPLAVDDKIFARDVQGKLVGLDRQTGEAEWDFMAPSQSLTLRSNPGLAQGFGGSIIAGFHGGVAMNLTSDSGEVRWKINVSIPSGENELERLSDVVGTPLVLGDTVCMAAFQGRLGCYQLDSGRLNWSFKVSAVGSLGFDQDDVFVADEFGDVVALDGKTGAVIWRNNSFKFRRLTGPTVFGRWVLVGDVDGMVLMIDAKDGSLVGTVKTDGSPILVNPLVIDDKVIIQTSKGNLYAFVLDQDF